jgi:hypothetical protein
MSARRLINAATIAGVGSVFWGAALASLELAAVGAAIGAIACVADYLIN